MIEARDPAGAPVALKVLLEDRDERLMRGEFERLSRLDHPRLVAVRDLGRLDRDLELGPRTVTAGALFVVLDLVRGIAPAAMLARLPAGEREAALLRLADDVADALDYLHCRGLVHRDIKPDNIIVGDDGRATVVDLGLATARGRTLSHARGTLAFLAPEALSGASDLRVDLYALGATLHALATGAPPFGGRGRGLVVRILSDPPPAVRSSWVSGDTAGLIERLLRKDPLERPATARAVRAELARIVGDHRRAARLSATSSLLPPAFCGRQQQVELVRAAIDRGVDGAAGAELVLVAGEPGSGKTRLIEEAVRQQRLRFAAGRAGRFEVLDAERLRGLACGDGGAERGERHLDDAATAAADAVAARPAATLLLLDGADELSLRVAEILVADPLPRQLALVVEGDGGDPRVRARLRAAAPERASLLELPPLDREVVAEIFLTMTGTVPAEEVARWLHDAGHGNPTIVGELVQQLAATEGLAADAPPSLAALLRRRRAGLPRAQRDLADALAVWGRPIEPSLLARLCRCGDERLWGRLLPLTTDGPLLSIDAADGRVRFASQLHFGGWREAIEPAERAAWHRRAAELAEDAPSVAEHLAAAVARGDERAGDLQRIVAGARDLRRRHRWGRAVAILEQLDVTAAEQHDVVERLLAELYVACGRYDAALALLGDACDASALLRAEALQRKGEYRRSEELLRALVERLEGEERERARVVLGRLLLRQGRPQEAWTAVTGAADDADLAGENSAGALEVAGLARFYLGDMDGAERLFGRGERSLDGGVRARFAGLRGMVAFRRGRLREAAEHHRAALDGARAAGDVHAVASCLGNLGSVNVELGRYGVAFEHLSDAVHQLSRLGRTAELGSALCNLGSLIVSMGDLDRADELAGQAAALLQRSGSRHLTGFVALLAGDICRRRGETEQAAARYADAETAFAAAEMSEEQLLALLAAADLSSEAGAAAAALEQIDAAEPLARSPEDRWRLAVSRARALLASRPAPARRERERRLVGELLAYCARLESRGALAELWRTAALLGALEARHDRRRAARVLRRARTAWEELMSDTPDIYRDRIGEDPDARRLLEQWQQLVDGAEEEIASLSPAGGEQPQQLRRLLEINKRINSELRLPILLETIVDSVIELTDAERGFLILVGAEDAEDAGGELAIKVARNIDRRSLAGEEIELSRSIAERAARSGEPVVTIDASDDERFQLARSVSHLHLRSALAVPLRVKGLVVGTIYVDHRLRSGAFGESEVALVQDFADQAAIAIENARLHAENQRRQQEIEQLNAQLAAEIADQAAALSEAREELRSNRQALQVRYDYANIIGRTPKMLELFRLLDRVTDTDLPVVIEGESGTGKELVARAIHVNGARTGRPFVGENCGAIPETLLESVLFGAVRGAYTGADRDRRGLFEVADGGTLFLDEVGEMSPAMQTKLLRVLQDGEFRPVGGHRTVSVDVRVIAASNRDLQQMVSRGTFREDLYYRLNVVRITIPPLRDRREDIPLLVAHFLAEHGGEGRQLERSALRRLTAYDWPGNVRQLENEVMRLAAMAGTVIGAEDLALPVERGAGVINPDDLRLRPRVERLERQLIGEALERTGGNRSKASRLLGLSRYGLLKKIKRLFPDEADAV